MERTQWRKLRGGKLLLRAKSSAVLSARLCDLIFALGAHAPLYPQERTLGGASVPVALLSRRRRPPSNYGAKLLIRPVINQTNFRYPQCTKQTPDRALRRHCRTCNLGRIASPVRTNLVFGSDNAPLFIDDQGLAQFYDAVVRPAFKDNTPGAGIAVKRSTQSRHCAGDKSVGSRFDWAPHE